MPVTWANNNEPGLLSSESTTQASSGLDSDPEEDPAAGESDSHQRLQEAIQMSVFRSTTDEQPSPVEDSFALRSSERDSLVARRKSLSAEAAERYRIGILVVSWVSMVILGLLGTATFALSLSEHNNASFAFALDALLVCASSVVLIWRYTVACCGNKITTFSTRREKIAVLALGVLFYVSALAVIVRCLVSLIKAEKPHTSDLMWKVFAANGFCCMIFSISEAILAARLKSVSVVMDAINTGLAAIISLSGCVTDVIFIKRKVSIWYIDSVIGIFCGITMIIYSTWAMAHVVFHSEPDKEDEEKT